MKKKLLNSVVVLYILSLWFRMSMKLMRYIYNRIWDNKKVWDRGQHFFWQFIRYDGAYESLKQDKKRSAYLKQRENL